MAEQTKHSCKVLVCEECGAKYSAKNIEMLVFVPFNVKNKGKKGDAHDGKLTKRLISP